MPSSILCRSTQKHQKCDSPELTLQVCGDLRKMMRWYFPRTHRVASLTGVTRKLYWH